MADLSVAYGGLLSAPPPQDAPYFVDTLPIQYQPVQPQPPVQPKYTNVVASEGPTRAPPLRPNLTQVVSQEVKFLSQLKPIMPMPDIVKQLEKELASVRRERDAQNSQDSQNPRETAVKEAFVVAQRAREDLPVQSLIMIVLVALALHLFIKKFIKHLADCNSKHELVLTVFYPVLLGFLLWFLVLKGKPAA